jgi:protein-S-isoprenylcysteine O-methyltransferase Ste14
MKHRIRFLLKSLSVSLVFTLILFISAGRSDYFEGWIYLSTNVFLNALNYLILRNNDELIAERSKVGEGTKSWDKVILGISGIVNIAMLILAGLDSGRYMYSPDYHWTIYAVGVFLVFLGNLIFVSAQRQNGFFSSVVRIQKERGHQVCDTGIYKFIRHPGYLGMIISFIGLPLLLGSMLSYIPALITIVLLVIRTYLEDTFLQKELNGYIDYTQNTRYRLIPGIW